MRTKLSEGSDGGSLESRTAAHDGQGIFSTVTGGSQRKLAGGKAMGLLFERLKGTSPGRWSRTPHNNNHNFLQTKMALGLLRGPLKQVQQHSTSTAQCRGGAASQDFPSPGNESGQATNSPAFWSIACTPHYSVTHPETSLAETGIWRQLGEGKEARAASFSHTPVTVPSSGSSEEDPTLLAGAADP